MRILCVCDGGNVRSTSLAYVLKHENKQEAIAIGRLCVSCDTMEMLCTWADVIVIMQQHMEASIPSVYKPKLRCVDVGEDRYGIWIHPELLPQVRAGAQWLLQQHEDYPKDDPRWTDAEPPEYLDTHIL